MYLNLLKKYQQQIFKSIIFILMTQQQPAWLRFLKAIDIFSYVPVPQAYPVSTTKSRAGSIIVILLLMAYVGYDLYLFIMKSVPTINASESSFINKGSSVLPEFAFGFKDMNYTKLKEYVVDTTNVTVIYKLSMGLTKSQNLDVLEDTDQLIEVPVEYCKQGSWPTQLGIDGCQYLNCISFTPQLINTINEKFGAQVVNKQGRILTQLQQASNNTLKLTLLSLKVFCDDYSFINEFNNQLVIFFNQAVGYDFATASEVRLPFPEGVDFWQFPLDYLNLKIFKFFSKTTQFVIDPNYLTRWTQQTVNYTRVVNVQNYDFKGNPGFLLAVIDFVPLTAMNLIEVHYAAFYENIAEVNSNIGLVVAIGVIFFLGYNRNKFNNRNPDWQRFDSVLHEKMIIEMQPTKSQRVEAEKDKKQEQQSQNSEI